MNGNKRLVWLWVLVLTAGYNTTAQEYTVRANLNIVPATGFYKIPVTPELTGCSKQDLSDIRIATSNNTFVPYVNQKSIAVIQPNSFLTFLMPVNSVSGKYTDIVLQNPVPTGITALSLVISNNAVERYTSISGSDDRQHWYIIADSMPFHGAYANRDGHYYQTISFPLSKYAFFRLKINNANSDPLHIIKAGTFKNADAANPEYITNPQPAISQKDSSDNNSYIFITNAASYLVDRISLEVSGPKFYHRTASVFIMHSDKDSSGLSTSVGTCTLASDVPVFFNLQGGKAKTILLVINNKDNPPLKVTGATTAQQAQYLVAWLEKGTAYHLLTNNPASGQPQYDLSYFKKDIPASLPVISYAQLTAIIPNTAQPAPPSKNYWLWPAIIAGVAVLGLLTYRLTKDVSNTKE